MKKQILFTLILFMSLTFTATAQSDVAPWSVGLSWGKLDYSGDYGSNLVFSSPESVFGARVSKYLSPMFDVSVSANFGKTGYENDSGTTDFTSSVTHFGLTGHFKILKDTKFIPFLSAGLGYGSFSADGGTSADDSGLVLPLVGLGFKYNISDVFGLFVHSQYGLYSGDDYDGNTTDDSNDNHLITEIGIGFNLGKKDMDGDKVADSKDACPETPGLKEYDGCPDSDLDGIIDGEDACPQVAGLAQYNGCPDTDGDGIIDGDDACPEVAGDAMYAGCPDTDGDGVGDNIDECPEESGVSRYNGCPIPDTDGDGFDDENDNCINTKGDLQGCPDGDGDGVADKDDACPETPGSVDAKGCPDADGDGIGDKFDKCPDEAGIPELEGCPKVRKPTTEEIINGYTSPTILFERGTIPAEGYDDHITSIVEFANAYPDAYLNIGGYSDSLGSESSNMRMSTRRAKKVYNSLVKAGIDAERLYYEGHGEANPVADNATAEGRRLNRRAVVTGSTVKRVVEKKGKKG